MLDFPGELRVSRAVPHRMSVAREPEVVSCPVCEPGTRSRQVTVRFGVRIVRCAGCGLVFANPQPSEEDLTEYYSPDYFQNNAGKFLQFPMPKDVELRLQQYVEEVKTHCAAGRVLDVGCGTGFFLSLCREAGFEVEGVELSDYAAQLGRERLGLEIRSGRLNELGTEQRREIGDAVGYEGITMWDFLEHTQDPRETLADARRLLRPGGHLFLTVPNVGSWWARCMGRRWVGFDKAREHLFYFTRPSLRGLLERAGFEPIKVRPHAWVCTFDFLAERGKKVWSGGGRMMQGAIGRMGLRDRVVRFPSVNLLAVARRTD